MLGDPRVVGGALQGQVKGDLQAVPARGTDELLEVGEGAQRRVDGVVAALGRADRPRGADVARPGVQAVVGPLRLTRPIGWIGGRYSTSKPIAATPGSRLAAVAKV